MRSSIPTGAILSALAHAASAARPEGDPGNLGHKMLQNVNGNRALTLLPLDDPELANVLPDGTPVYALRRVTTKKGLLRSRKLATPCTSAVVVGRRDRLPPGLADAVSKLLQQNRDRIASTR